MRYLSTFSGIEAATVAWHSLGWEPVGFSEIEPFPSAVLNHHYPHVQNYGDITQFGSWSVEPFRLLVGGSPCQSFSVAGLRKGLADERGNLMLTFGRLAQHYRPTWLVWENVPGVLSSNGGRDFAAFLTMLAEFGYGFAYRVLDAQYFGVAQRRRRVFLVAHLRDWRPAAAVLFDPHSLSGHPPPSREKGKGTSGGFADGTPTTCPTIGTELAKQVNNQMVANAEAFYHVHAVPHAFKLRGGCDGVGKGYLGQDECAFTLSTHQDQHLAQPMTYDMAQVTPPINSQNRKPGDPCHTLAKGNAGNAAVVQPVVFHATRRDGGRLIEDVIPTVEAHWGTGGGNVPTVTQSVMTQYAVRRLTPVEAERLQGFPDNYTAIPWRGKDASQCPDGPRYKALGNSMAVPVMRWIGERIQAVDDMMKELKR